MHHGRILVALVTVVAGITASVGCASSGSQPGLEGVEWHLSAASVSSSDLGGAGITARFEDGLVGGTGGVNSYSAPYEAGRTGSLEIGDVTSTLIAALDAEANTAEAAYFAVLGEVAGYVLEGGTLTLLDANGNELLVFTRAE